METLYDLGLRMNVFTDMEDALQWLESMKDKQPWVRVEKKSPKLVLRFKLDDLK
ncbi:MAG TPA: hypothetical protein VJ508_20475 [Saprospiraceae bacterium]|nr:hypothetical protein [Saprospiraceae bacterium]